MTVGIARTTRATALATALAIALLTSAGIARAAWVTDGIRIGLHEEPTLDSAITALVQSGAELEVLGRDGKLVRVRASDGTEGWVDERYVVDEPPAISLLAQARDALRDAQAQITALAGQVETFDARSAELTAERDALRAEVEAGGERVEAGREQLEAARTQLEAASERLDALEAARESADRERSRLQAELDSRGAAPVDSEALSRALGDLQRLAEENRDLKQELAILEANQDMVATAEGADPLEQDREPAPEPTVDRDDVANAAIVSHAPGQPNLLGFLDWQAWQWMLLGSSLLLAFGAGGYVVDLGIRRRHGGFRI